jgi:branched-chain amino acid aminotransferase
VTASPRPAPAPPARVVVATSTRRNDRSPLAAVKALGALDGLLARREARARGADDALLLATGGQVAEAPVANVFACVDGELLTPRVEDGVLPGVARAAVLALGAAREARLGPDDLARASEVFLSNALGLRAVGSLEGRPVGGGAEGPQVRSLRRRLFPPDG